MDAIALNYALNYWAEVQLLEVSNTFSLFTVPVLIHDIYWLI